MLVMQAFIRDFVDIRLLRLKNLKQLPIKHPRITDEQLKAYEATEGPYLTKENFTIDFTRGWRSSSLNREVETFVVDNFIDAHAGGEYNDPPLPPRFLTRGMIADVLKSHVEYLRGEYKRHTEPDSELKEQRAQTTRLRKRFNARRKTVRPFLCDNCPSLNPSPSRHSGSARRSSTFMTCLSTKFCSTGSGPAT